MRNVRNMHKDVRGTILIEFVGSFLLFVLLILSILSLVNIVTLQARVNYALTQSANTLSMYGYVLHVIGFDEKMMKIDEGAKKVKGEINESIGEINDVLGEINNLPNTLSLSGIQSGTDAVMERFGSWADYADEHPKEAIQGMMQFGLSEGSGAAFEQMLRPLVMHYLSNGGMTGEEYLKSVGVNGKLDFYAFPLPGYTSAGAGELVGSITKLEDDSSVPLDKDGNIRITLQYEVDYSFMGLPLPFDPKLKITQSAVTKMWLGGSGDGYDG